MRPQHWLYRIPLRLRFLFRRHHVEQELNEELQFHLERKIEEGIASGLSAKQARYVAMRAIDGLEQRKEEMRDMRRIHWLTDFLDDARFAIRSLRRTPGVTDRPSKEFLRGPRRSRIKCKRATNNIQPNAIPTNHQKPIRYTSCV